MNFEKLFLELKKNRIDFFTGVPDSFLNGFCNYLTNNISSKNHVIAANEGNSIAIAAGYHMGSNQIPLVYMQNSGLGNALNPLVSLTHHNVYEIPMILLIGWRGQPDTNDWAQHKIQGEITNTLLDDVDIPYRIMDSDNSLECITWAAAKAHKINAPVAIIVKKNVLTEKKLETYQKKYSMNRERAIECVIKNAEDNSIFVATTGRATRELFFVREKLKQKHNHDFLNVGSMGHASSIALGLAKSNPNKLIYCFDGDASAIMHMGSLAINGTSGTNNIIHILLNNGLHESVGGQPSVGYKIDFNKIAKACGYETYHKKITSQDELNHALRNRANTNKNLFLNVYVSPGINSKFSSLNINHIKSKEKFMEYIQNN